MSAHRAFHAAEIRASKDGSVELSFSSETPVPMDGVPEVLEHGPGAVDLARLNAGGSVLFEHERTQVIGVVEKAWIDGSKGRARIRFGTTQLAADVARDVMAGIRRGVSVGYAVLKSYMQNGIRRVTRWQPYELSITSIPADFSIGVGRSMQPSAPKSKETTMSIRLKELNETRGGKRKALATFRYAGEVPTEEETHAVETLESEVRRLDAAIAAEERAMNFAIQASMREGRQSRDAGFPAITRGEFQYDLTKAIREQGVNRLSGLELETHQELVRTMPAAARGVVIPWTAVRDLTVTGQTSIPGDQGGLSVSTVAKEIADPLWNARVLQRLGATFFTGLQGDLELPRGTATTVSWKSETASLAESQPVIGSLSLKPRRIGSFVEVSNQLLIQSSTDVQLWLRRNLENAILDAWQAAAINGAGSGANEPLGLLGTTGVAAVALGTDGGAPTWNSLVQLEGLVSQVDADIGRIGFLTNTKVRAKLKTTPRIASTDSRCIWDDSDRLLAYPTGVTNGVPSNLTKGTSGAVCSAIIFGNFADMVLAQWGNGIDVVVDPYSAAKTGMTVLVANAYLDAGVRRGESFAAIKDALTT